MKRNGKRIFSVAMALALMLNLLPIAALAAPASTGGQGAYVDLSAEDTDTSSGYREVEAHQIAIQNKESNDVLWMDKTMKPVVNEPDAYDVTLSATTSEEIKNIITSPDTAVVLVFDVSGSMTSNKVTDLDEVGKITRLEAMRKAGAIFFDDYVKSAADSSNDVKRMLAVTAFSGKATENLGWTDVAKGSDAARAVITGIKNGNGNGSGTNIGAGLEKAASLLGSEAVKDYTYKYVILLTDGAPSPESTYDKAETQAAALKDSGVTLFAISFDNQESFTRTFKGEKVTVNCGTTWEHSHWKYEVEQYHYTGGTGNGPYWEKFSGTHSGYEIKDVKKKILTSDWLKGYIATPASGDQTYFYTPNNAGALKDAFGGILSTISDMSKAWTITDPIGGMYTFEGLRVGGKLITDEAGLDAQHVTLKDGTLTWDVKSSVYSDKTGDNPYFYTYKLTYRVKLEVGKEGFVTGKEYPANGATTLRYTVDDNGNLGIGDTKTQDFYVPTAWGTVPTAEYTIAYYKWDKATKAYPTEPTDTSGPYTADLWTTVNVVDKDANYATKYASDNYVPGGEDNILSLRLTDTGARTLKVFYDPIPATVTVNHYYGTVSADGTEKVYPATPQVSDSIADQYQGDSYTATEKPALGGSTHTPDSNKSDSLTINALGANENVINLYYYLDSRDVAPYAVERVYNQKVWELQDVDGLDTWVLVDQPFTIPGASGSGHAGDGFSISTASGEAGYTFNGTAVSDPTGVIVAEDGKTASMTLSPGANKITLYYDMDEGPALDKMKVNVTVNHHYTKTTVTIADGKPSTSVFPDDHVEEVKVEKHAGEEFQPSEVRDYDEETYNPDPGNADKLVTITLEAGQEPVIDLYYTLYEGPKTTEVTVTHTYYKDVTVIDPETQEETTESVEQEGLYWEETFPAVGGKLYVGETFIASPKQPEGETGYLCDMEAADQTITLVLKAEENKIDLTYSKDERDAATMAVTHVYYTDLETIVNGAVATRRDTDATVSGDAITGQAGDPYTIAPITYNELYSDYVLQEAESGALEGILVSGSNPTVTLYYLRADSDLVETSYTVNYHYMEQTMTVNEEGVAGYHEDPVENREMLVSGTPVSEDMYVDLVIALESKPVTGYTADTANPALTQTLGADANTYDFYYLKQIPLDQYNVTVNHYYTDITIDEVGQRHEANSESLGVPQPTYVGAAYGAQLQSGGRDYGSVTVTEGVEYTQDEETKAVTGFMPGQDVVVNFYYSKVVEDRSVPATYRVTHVYKTYDWDGREVSSDTPEPITGSSYATLSYTATPDRGQDDGGNPLFEIQSATASNGFSDEDTYTVKLAAGQNSIEFVYERHIDTRVSTSVKVIHNYFARDTFTVEKDLSDADYIASSTAEYTNMKVLSGREKDIYVGASFTAKQVPVYTWTTAGDDDEEITHTQTYEFVNADPEGGTIASLSAVGHNAMSGSNVIVINYIREFDSRVGTSVTVTHRYFTYDSYTGRRTEDTALIEEQTFTDLEEGIYVGATFTATAISKTGYSLENTTEDMTITLAKGTNTMELTYLRNTNSRPTGGGGGTDDPPEKPPVKPPVVDVPEVEIPEPEPPLGELIIPDEAPPLAALPERPADGDETVIIDESIPLGNLPQTGTERDRRLQTAARLLTLGGLLATGAMLVGNKKREEEGR